MKHRKAAILVVVATMGLVTLSLAIARSFSDSCDLSQLFVEANQFYNQGKFDEARSRYEQLIEAIHNGDLYYNLGNTYLKTGEIGRAIHSYRNALLYKPRNQDLKANLGYARSQAKDQLESSSQFPILRSFCFWYDAFSLHELLFVLIVVNTLFWTVVLLRLWFRNEFLYWSFVVTLILLLTAGATWAAKAYHTVMSPEAVVIIEELPVRSGNDLKSTVLFYLHDGAEVRAVSKNTEWAKIELPDGKKGWVQQAFIGIVGEDLKSHTEESG